MHDMISIRSKGRALLKEYRRRDMDGQFTDLEGNWKANQSGNLFGGAELSVTGLASFAATCLSTNPLSSAVVFLSPPS